jgi:hypothetical protein
MKPHILFISLVITIFFLGYFYFTAISPIFIAKPVIEKPQSLSIDDSHIIFILNEMEAYRLHENPLTGEPAVVDINIDGKSSRFQIKDSEYIKTQSKQDLTIYITEKDMKQVLEGDAKTELLKLLKEDRIHIETFEDEKILALKGYKVIYDKFSSNQVTGNIILPIANGFNLLFLFLAAAAVNIIAKKI